MLYVHMFICDRGWLSPNKKSKLDSSDCTLKGFRDSTVGVLEKIRIARLHKGMLYNITFHVFGFLLSENLSG